MILSILSVDCIPTADWLSSLDELLLASGCNASLLLLFLRLDTMSTGYAIALKLATGSTVARDWMRCCLRLVVQSLVSNACDWTSHDWVDQTMSYQLIQTTSFAMHPRLIEYTSLLLRLDEQATC
ncbi:flowering time control protein FCA [Dorcoceras hygrometricum]|uniref:Flowering time control protein FCA n=1 Tax=Dorcoceras hygrometricum TaxID=472368 RepID=A0A2Z7CHV8_9LAMI|nr:flowering time control protein FCA [Dorcoceras hygrometricum]